MFDVIITNLVLEHMQDLAHLFAEAHHVLRPGGLLSTCASAASAWGSQKVISMARYMR